MMKRNAKTLLVTSLALGLMIQSIPVHANSIDITTGNVNVQIWGQTAKLKDASGNGIEPLNYNGTVYLPIRGVAEALGLSVDYDQTDQVVKLTGEVKRSNTKQTDTAATDGIQPTGTPPDGTQPTGMPQMGTPPDGTQPTGMPQMGTPPDGTQPTGMPQMGTPPDGTQPTGVQPDGAQPAGTLSEKGQQNKSQTDTANSNKVPVQKKVDAQFGDIHVNLNGTQLEMKDVTGNAVEPFNYNGTIYLPVRAVAEGLGLEVSFDSNTGTVNLGGAAAESSATATGTTTETSGASGTATMVVSGTTESVVGESLSADEEDQSIVKVTEAGKLTLSSMTLSKTGDTSSEEDSNFYGLNAGVLAEDGGQIIFSDSTINTDAEGANAVFSTGEESVVNVSNVTIKTTENSSRGLDATYGGTIVAKDVTIDTAGDHCGALATDRGEGTVKVERAKINTSGEGSPGIYSTGNITVSDSTLAATGSEAAVIEGKNSITLTDVLLSGAKKWGVMIYQSFSGDADVGVGTYTMDGGTLTAEEGPLFYSTNTTAVINLKEASLQGESGTLIQAEAGDWGTEGSNGADVTLNAENQKLEGNVNADAISSVAMVLNDDSVFTGTIDGENTAQTTTLELKNGSKWNVTGTSYLTVLTIDDEDLENIEDNGNTIYYDADNEANEWLNGTVHSLQDGGSLIPINE